MRTKNNLTDFLFEEKINDDKPLFDSAKELSIILLKNEKSRYYKKEIDYTKVQNVLSYISKSLRIQLNDKRTIEKFRNELKLAIEEKFFENLKNYNKIIDRFDQVFEKRYYFNLVY